MNENELLKEITSKINWEDVASKLGFDKKLFDNGKSFVECITWSLWKRILSKTNNDAIIECIEDVFSNLKSKDFSFDDLPLETLRNDYDHDLLDGIETKLLNNDFNVHRDIPTEISKHVSEWKRFGRFLGISDGILNQIEIKHSIYYDRVHAVMTEFSHPEPINNSWGFWKKKLSQYPEGDKITREVEITFPEVINEASDSTCHMGINQNNGLLFHHHMSIEKDKPFPLSSKKEIAVYIGGGGTELVHYQYYKDFMKTRADYFKLYEMFSDFKTFDFTTSDQKKCPILNSIRCFLEQSKCDGFAYKGYSLRNHYTLFAEYDVPQEKVNNNILAYFSNDNVLIRIKTCDDIKDISRILNSFLEDVQFAQAVHECVSNNPVIHIGVVLVDDNILDNSDAFVCYQCVKNCLILPKSTFSNKGGFADWYDYAIKSNGSFEQMKNSLNSINQALEIISTELKRNIICQMALKSFDFPSFTPLPDYQMKELEKLVLLTAGQMKILYSPHKHIMIKGSYGSGKSLVLQERFKQTLEESDDNDIFYLICHDQMSKFATQMKLVSMQYPNKLILVCNSREISEEQTKISYILKYIRETWKSRRVHVYIDEFNGQYLDKDEVYKIKEQMKYLDNSHIVIAVQSMEYKFYERFNSGFREKDGVGFKYKMLTEETNFFVHQLEYSLRCSVEINSSVNDIIYYLSDEYMKFANAQNACISTDGTIVDRELALEKVVTYSYDTDAYYRYFYNPTNHFGHNVSSDKVKVYSPDKGLESKNCINIILYHLLTCIEEKVVVSTFDGRIFHEVFHYLQNTECNWTTDIEGFITKNSSFQVLLTDYASIRGFEFPNVIFLLGSDLKFLKFRLVECLTRATTNLSLVLKFNVHGLLNIWKSSSCVEYKELYFDHSQDIYYFRSRDESETKILIRNVSAECAVMFNPYISGASYPWAFIYEKEKTIRQTDVLKSTIEIIFKQDIVKLFEDLVHLHSIDISNHRMLSFEGNLLHLAAKYNASKLCTLICNQYSELVNSYDNYKYTPLQVAAKYNSDLVATILINHGVQVNIASAASNITPLHITAMHNSDKVASILLDNRADVNSFDVKHRTPLHFASLCYTDNVTSTAKVFLERGTDVKISSPHQHVLKCWNFHIKSILLNHGADVNGQDYNGDTPLHIAIKCRNYDTSNLFLKKGADVNIQNNQSQTPLDIAVNNNDSRLADILNEHETEENFL